jgi:hypothetical protein
VNDARSIIAGSILVTSVLLLVVIGVMALAVWLGPIR